MNASETNRDGRKGRDLVSPLWGRYRPLPDVVVPADLREAHMAAGWMFGPKGNEQPPSLERLAEMLADTGGDAWMSGALLWRRGEGFFLAEPVWRELMVTID